jgi:hypothetical protein
MVNINILQQTLFHFFQDAIGVKFQEILFKRENKQILTKGCPLQQSPSQLSDV